MKSAFESKLVQKNIKPTAIRQLVYEVLFKHQKTLSTLMGYNFMKVFYGPLMIGLVLVLC